MGKDWISGLPDHVLEHILSFLTLKEAVRTSILSRRWRKINITSILTNLNFSNLFFKNIITRRNSNSRKKNKRLVKVVDKILVGRSQENTLGVDKLFLEFPHLNDTSLTRRALESKLERWMQCVAKPGLLELNLLMCFTCGHYYDFPLATFAAIQSLQKLTLMGFQLTSISHCDSVSFLSLRSLCLWKVVLDDDVMQKLLKDIPLLENLEVDSCRGLKVLRVRQPQLKMLEVRCNKGLRTVEINAPELEVLKLSPPKEMLFVETCLPCLQKIKFKKSSSSTLKTLVDFRGLKLPIDVWFTEFLPLCPLLEQLSIDSSPTLRNINVSTPLQALKTLRLTNLENMVNISIIAPNLEKCYITAYRNLPVVELNASNILEVKIQLNLGGELGDLWHERLANFVGYFNHSRVVKFSFTTGWGLLVPKEKRKDLPFPLKGTKHLEFTTGKFYRRLLWEYVDCMLWLSPQATNLTIREDPVCDNVTEMVLELVYEEETFAKSPSCACCAVLAAKCWQHGLKEVKIQEFVGDEAQKASLKSWLWEEVDNLSVTETSFNPDSIYGGKYTLYDQLYKD